MKERIPAKTILFLTANPSATRHLRLNEEFREIREGLRGARHREQIRLEAVTAVRPRDMRRAVLDLEPEFVHFSGHGSEDGELVFENADGSPHYLGGEALGTFFEIFSDHVRCVVLNACYSEPLAKAIGQHVDYVVGMEGVIEDDAAILYAVAFYDALGAGTSVEKAHRVGRSALELEGLPGHLIPVLHRAEGADADALKTQSADQAASSKTGPGTKVWLSEVSHLYHRPTAARTLLMGIGFPNEKMPLFDAANASEFWEQVRALLQDGVAEDVGLQDLLEEAQREYPGNPILKQAVER